MLKLEFRNGEVFYMPRDFIRIVSDGTDSVDFSSEESEIESLRSRIAYSEHISMSSQFSDLFEFGSHRSSACSNVR